MRTHSSNDSLIDGGESKVSVVHQREKRRAGEESERTRSEMTFLASELVRMSVSSVRRWTDAFSASFLSSPLLVGSTSLDWAPRDTSVYGNAKTAGAMESAS